MFEPVPSPEDQPEVKSGPRIPALIEGVVPIPPVLLLRNKGALERLYSREHISARKISHVAGASRSGVIKALDRFSIPRENDRPVRTGHLPFGVDYISHQLVKNEAEKATIRMMQEQRAAGQSLREIVRSLNRAFIPIKQNGLW